MGFRLAPKSMTLNDLEQRNGRAFCVISPNSVAFGANYVKVVDQPSTDFLVEDFFVLAWSSSQPFAAKITFSSSETCCFFMNSFSLGKNRSHLEPGQRTWSHISSHTGCHPRCRLWTTPAPTIFVIRIRIARQMAGWKTKSNNSSTTESELLRNAGPGAF